MDLLIQDPKHMGSTRALIRVLFFLPHSAAGRVGISTNLPFPARYDAFCARFMKDAKSF